MHKFREQNVFVLLVFGGIVKERFVGFLDLNLLTGVWIVDADR